MFPWPQPSCPFLSLDLKPWPLPNRNHWVRFRLLLFKSFSNTCSHFRMQVFPSGHFYKHWWVSVPLITCLLTVPPMNALSRWTFVYHLARAKNCGWRSTNTNTPGAKPSSFEHPSLHCSNISTYSMCHLGYVMLSFWYSMTVAENAVDAEFTFREQLVCASHCETSLWLALLAGRQGWWMDMVSSWSDWLVRFL